MAWRKAGEPRAVMDRPGRTAQLSRPADPPTGTEPAPAGTIIGRRSGGPGLRAVVGGLLVTAAAVLVFTAALSAAGGRRTSYVVAARTLPAGTVIGPGDLGLARMTLGGGTGAAAFRTPDDLVGRTVTVTLSPGELVQSSMLGTATGSNRRPVSIPVDPDSLAALATGDPVDVLETPSSGASASGASGPGLTVVLRGADLSAVTRPASGLLSGDGSGTVVVTLGVSNLAQAEAVVAASHAGTIELIRAEPSDGSGTGPARGSGAGSSAGSSDGSAGSGSSSSGGSSDGSAGSGSSSSGGSTP